MRKRLLSVIILLIPMYSWALTYGFVDVDPDNYKVQTGTQITVDNMPVVRSQDTIGICYAFAAATAIDAANCRSEKIDCSQMKPKDKVSTFDLAKYTNDLGESGGSSSKFTFGGLEGGGDALLTIKNSMFEVGSVTNEECVPFDQIVAKAGTPAEAQKLQLEAWNRLKQTYETYKKKYQECPTCAADFASTASDGIKEDFNLQASNADILKAFSADSYSKFLDQLLIPDKCTKIRQLISFASPQVLQAFPLTGKSNYPTEIAKIKDVLGKQNPVVINGYCADEKKPASMKACQGVHMFVVSGYRKVCNAQNQCRELLKVQNSWGQAWQDAHNGGWLDAKEILDRTYYDQASLGWLEPKID